MWILGLSLCLGADRLRQPPDGFVDLQDAVPGVQLSIRYHTTANFTGGPLPGYGAPGAWMHAAAASSLASVQEGLAASGLGLLVFDAYRPRRASAAMVAWASRSGQEWVLAQGYVAKHSRHNTGTAVDVTLVRRSDGQPLDMGGEWDVFSEISHTVQVTGPALENRLALREAMVAAGWQPYSKEWWHFRFPVSASARDVPYGCFEADEGQWVPPEDWSEAGYVAPGWPETVDCR
jgi:D-alanyl-D-alanine dipeptidase